VANSGNARPARATSGLTLGQERSCLLKLRDFAVDFCDYAIILVPEVEIDIDEVCRLIKYGREHGKKFSIVVAAEGAKFPDAGQATHGTAVDSFGHARLSGIGQHLAEEIEKRTGYETRSVNLGHTQRGGTPSAYDRMLAK
jgi:6-phosphofructokinase